MKAKTTITELISTKITVFEKATELNRLLGLDGTLQLLYYLSEQARQYKDIAENSDLPKTTLIRRIDSLQQFKIISKNPTIIKGRKTNLYCLDQLGLELMTFIKRYERLTSLTTTQQKI